MFKHNLFVYIWSSACKTGELTVESEWNTLSPARFLFFDNCYFYWDNQREPPWRRSERLYKKTSLPLSWSCDREVHPSWGSNTQSDYVRKHVSRSLPWGWSDQVGDLTPAKFENHEKQNFQTYIKRKHKIWHQIKQATSVAKGRNLNFCFQLTFTIANNHHIKSTCLIITRLRAVPYFSLQSYYTQNLSTRAAKPLDPYIITSWFTIVLDEINN